VFAVIELPFTSVPSATNVVIGVMSPKLFAYWSYAITEKFCVWPTWIVAVLGLIIMLAMPAGVM